MDEEPKPEPDAPAPEPEIKNPEKIRTPVIYQRYVCADPNCKELAPDIPAGKRRSQTTLKLYPYEQVQPVINCYNCGGGRGLPLEQMMKEKVGMFPVKMESVK